MKNLPSSAFDIVALAASAGGLRALSTVLVALPRHFPAPIILLQHVEAHHPNLLAGILSRRTSLAVKYAEEGERAQAGSVYVAPRDRHLLITPDGSFTLTQTELVHFVRPA